MMPDQQSMQSRILHNQSQAKHSKLVIQLVPIYLGVYGGRIYTLIRLGGRILTVAVIYDGIYILPSNYRFM